MPTSTAELGPSFGERKQDGFKHSLSNRMVIKQPLKPVAQAGVLGKTLASEKGAHSWTQAAAPPVMDGRTKAALMKN